MKKPQVSFVCQECGYDSPAFLGKCPECGLWNTFKEIHLNSATSNRSSQRPVLLESDKKPKKLSEIIASEKERISTGFLELDGVLGGGLVKGSVILLAGDPGIGKSTLLLQVGMNVAMSSEFRVQRREKKNLL